MTEIKTEVKKHVHADIIHAYADGALIEYYDGEVWREAYSPCFADSVSYRIKPVPKPDLVFYGTVGGIGDYPARAVVGQFLTANRTPEDGLRYTFDSVTGKIKSVEVLP